MPSVGIAEGLSQRGVAVAGLPDDAARGPVVEHGGHSPQMRGFLSVYLPSNGALLAAVAHIVRVHRAGHELPAGWAMKYAGFAPDEEPGW